MPERWQRRVVATTIRECRLALHASQTTFAAKLGVSKESDRTWDSGRRTPSQAILTKAQVLADAVEASQLLPLDDLAARIGVHVRTLRGAARDGRLPVTFDKKTTFRQLRARATPADAVRFRQTRFRQHVPAADRPALPTWSSVPVDFDRAIRALRLELGLSQRTFAQRIGAAGKAVIYQWESRKRTPSPVLWARVLTLGLARPRATQDTGQGRRTLLPPATERMCRCSRRNA